MRDMMFQPIKAPRACAKSLGSALMAIFAMLPGLVRAAPAVPESGDCSLESATPATVAAVDDDFSLLLDDGRRAALAGLEFPPADLPEFRKAVRKRLEGMLSGRDVFVGLFATAPDRWGRLPARLFAAQGMNAPLVSVGVLLLEEGLVRFRPDPSVGPCAAAYLNAEAQARAGKAGVWSREELKVTDLLDPMSWNALLRRKGMAVVEGRIRSVGESTRAIYLNFEEKKLDGFAVVISRRNLAMFTAAGISPGSLVGRRARVRGLIETGFGPRLEISSPVEIEIIDDESRR